MSPSSSPWGSWPGFWLRPGNSSCASNVVAFTLDLLDYLPTFIRLLVVRADAGFCLPVWLDLLERLGWLDRVTAAPLRFRLFTTGGVISQTVGRTTIRLSVPTAERQWWREVLTKLRCEFPNCNAVSQTPG